MPQVNTGALSDKLLLEAVPNPGSNASIILKETPPCITNHS